MNSLSALIRARLNAFLLLALMTLHLGVTVGCSGASSGSPPPQSSLKITGSIQQNAVNGVTYSSTNQATGGAPAYTWSIVSGQLPLGLTLAATTGSISGTPTTNGTYEFTLRVGDSSSPPQNATQADSITVSANPYDQYGGLIAMPSSNPPTGVFRVEKFLNNKWMFVDPDNNAFFLTGMEVLQYDTHVDDIGGDYYDRILAKYSTLQNWSVAQEERLESWGFNSSGINPYTMFLPNPSNPVRMPVIYEAWPGGYSMKNIYNWAPNPVKNLVNVFSPNYTGWRSPSGIADYYDSNLAIFMQNELKNDSYLKSIDKTYLIGIFSDDGDFTNGFGAGPDFASQPPGHTNFHLGLTTLTGSPLDAADSNFGFLYADAEVKSKKALHDMLVSKYGTIDSLNSAWGSNYSTFDSSGTVITGESIGTGDGTTLTFSKTLANVPISNLSLQISVNGVAVAGDNSCCSLPASGHAWGPTVGSSSLNRTTGALTITFKAGNAPAAGAVITANYVQNGWGYGTGLMDENFSAAHQAWLGNEFIYLNAANANVKVDLDRFLFNIAAWYFSTCRSQIQAVLPGVLYLGPDPLGTFSVPSNRQVLAAAAQYLDVMEIGGGFPLSQAELDYVYTYSGDKPIIVSQYRTANADSALFRHGESSGHDFATQQARGGDYLNSVTLLPAAAYTVSGSRPYVGVVWWQYLDNFAEKNNWGLVSLSDNAYDGHEAVTGSGGVGVRSIPCSDPISNYTCGGEERNYGDVITSVTNAHKQIQQAVQH